jgi:hypothetical protein
MKSQACSSIFQSTSFPTRRSADRPKNRVYQSMLMSTSDTGTPAKRSMMPLISGWETVRAYRPVFSVGPIFCQKVSQFPS